MQDARRDSADGKRRGKGKSKDENKPRKGGS